MRRSENLTAALRITAAGIVVGHSPCLRLPVGEMTIY